MVVRGDANHEHVGVLVLHLTIHAEMLVTAGIVNFDLDLLLLHVLDAPVDIEHGRFVILGETVVEVVRNQARLTDRSVSRQDELKGLLTSVILGPALSFSIPSLSFIGLSSACRRISFYLLFYLLLRGCR